MTKNKKHHYSSENAYSMSMKEVKQVKEIKLKYLSEKENEYGTNHFFQVLDETPLQELIELGKTIRIITWQYNGKYYLKTNAVKVKEAQVEHDFKKRSTIHYGFNLFKIRC